MSFRFAVGDALDAGTFPALSALPAFSLAMWVKLDNPTGDQAFVMRGSEFSGSAPFLWWRDELGSVSGRVKTLAVLVATNSGVLRAEAADNAINDDAWSHVGMAFEGGRADGLRLYVDGLRDANVVSTVGHASNVATSDMLTLSTTALGRELVGDAAELAAFQSALADEDFAALARGVSPLDLASRRDSLALYQDLIRPLNHPGVGPGVTAIGAPSVTEHPRRVGLGMDRHAFERRRPPTPVGRIVAAACGLAGAVAGEPFIAGADTGEVNSLVEVTN